MKILFLDDNEDRFRTFQSYYDETSVWTYWVTTAAEAIAALQIKDFDLIMLDHDLGLETFVNSNRVDCGYEVVRWIINNKNSYRFPLIIVHSWNIVASNNMVSDLQKAKFNAEFIPFGASGFKRIFTQLTDKLSKI